MNALSIYPPPPPPPTEKGYCLISIKRCQCVLNSINKHRYNRCTLSYTLASKLPFALTSCIKNFISCCSSPWLTGRYKLMTNLVLIFWLRAEPHFLQVMTTRYRLYTRSALHHLGKRLLNVHLDITLCSWLGSKYPLTTAKCGWLSQRKTSYSGAADTTQPKYRPAC